MNSWEMGGNIKHKDLSKHFSSISNPHKEIRVDKFFSSNIEQISLIKTNNK